MAVNLNDIAEKAKVTKAVVSEILRNHPNAERFSEDTKKRVLQVAKELKYYPNFFASQIQAQNRKLVMLTLSDLHDPFGSYIAQCFEKQLTDAGYNLLINVASNSKDKEFYKKMLGKHGILGLIVIGYSTQTRLSDELLIELAGKGVKIMTIGRAIDCDKISQIYYTNTLGVHKVIDYLLEQKAESFWLLGNRSSESIHSTNDFEVDRTAIAVKYLKEKGIKESKVSILECYSTPQKGEQAIKNVIKKDSLPDAIICPSDYTAWGAISALTNAGIEVGKDIAVVGYNNNELSSFFKPTLTTINIPQEGLGIKGAEMFIKFYKNKNSKAEKLVLPVELVIRESGKLAK